MSLDVFYIYRQVCISDVLSNRWPHEYLKVTVTCISFSCDFAKYCNHCFGNSWVNYSVGKLISLALGHLSGHAFPLGTDGIALMCRVIIISCTQLAKDTTISSNQAPRKFLEQTTIYFYFLFFRENNAWHYMWIVCQADDSHVMSSIISSEKYE